MSHTAQPLPMAGDYLVATFADIMHSARFRKHVWAHMQLSERRRLESLRLQALYGDAPNHNNTRELAAADGETGKAKDAAEASKGEVTERPSSSPTHPAKGAAAPSPPRWYDIAGRARYDAWVALRGCMSPDVAAECFCAEFLGLIKKYPHPALLPPVEAALSTAHRLAQRARNSRPQSRLRQDSHAPSSLTSTSATSTKATPVFQVRALQGDPAALALLWICRAYRIPCEFTVEPLSKALGPRRRASSAATPVPASTAPSPTAAAPPPPPATTANPYLPYTLADACYPFSASLTCPVSMSASTNTNSTTAVAVAAAGGATTTTVTTPEAAFVLIADTFLAAYPHWMGVPSDVPPSSSSSSLAGPSQALLQRCGWIEELQHITRHVRTPILALLVQHATQTSTLSSSASETAARSALLRTVAAHLHRYESWTMDRVMQRRVGQAQSVLSPLLASTAVVDALQHAYAVDAKAVTAADVFVASCGYVLCTHPFCADVFPLLRVPVACALDDGGAAVVRSEWPAHETATAPTSAAKAATYAPWALPLHLSGLSAVYNAKINRLLRREAAAAVRHEQQQQPARLLINDSDAVPVESSGVVGPTSTRQQQQQQRNVGYYAVSSASVTKEAAEAVGQLILTRLSSLRSDDLQHDSVVGSNSSVSGAPFLVLGQVFALTWALAQEQVPAFPYFMLDGNPDHFGGFSFMSEETGDPAALHRRASSGNESKSGSRAHAGATAVAAALRARPCFHVSLAPAAVARGAVDLPHTDHHGNSGDSVPVTLPTLVTGSAATRSASSQDGGISVESRLRSGLHLAGSLFVKGVRRLSGTSRDDDNAQGGRNSGVHATHVLRSQGEGNNSVGSDGGAAGVGVDVAASHAISAHL